MKEVCKDIEVEPCLQGLHCEAFAIEVPRLKTTLDWISKLMDSSIHVSAEFSLMPKFLIRKLGVAQEAYRIRIYRLPPVFLSPQVINMLYSTLSCVGRAPGGLKNISSLKWGGGTE